MLRTVAIVGAAVALGVLAFVLALGSGSGDGVAIDAIGADAGPAASDGIGSTLDASAIAGGALVVEVSGAVAHPGVFRLPAGSRVGDVVAAAGGYGPRVDTGRAGADLNLAATLNDGDRVHVPSRDESPAPTIGGSALRGAGAGGTGGDPVLVDLNSATADALDALPGIGPVTADKIIAAREEAPFASVDDLRSRGILGEKTFERLRDLVTVP